MTRPLVNPGTVEWAGENPGMYLRHQADGPFITLISFFRVVVSAHGAGHAAFMLLDPHGDGHDPERPNVCITDNEPLAAYLRDNFVANFLAFRGNQALAGARMVPGWDFAPAGDGGTQHTEGFRSAIGEVQLVWKGWGDRFMVEMSKERSVTGKHEMFSMFVDVHEIAGHINGRALAGRPFPREFADKKDSSTAHLAFAETWLRIPD